MQQTKVCHVAHLRDILSEEKTVDKSFLVVYNKGRKKHIDCLLSDVFNNFVYTNEQRDGCY